MIYEEDEKGKKKGKKTWKKSKGWPTRERTKKSSREEKLERRGEGGPKTQPATRTGPIHATPGSGGQYKRKKGKFFDQFRPSGSKSGEKKKTLKNARADKTEKGGKEKLKIKSGGGKQSGLLAAPKKGGGKKR